MNRNDEPKLVQSLIEIKKSIIREAPDTLFMSESNETICERIDHILETYFEVSTDELEKHYVTTIREELGIKSPNELEQEQKGRDRETFKSINEKN